MNTYRSKTGENRHRGAVAVLLAVTAPVVIAFVALSVDVGMMYNAKADLQRAADAAALASVGILRGAHLHSDLLNTARQTAKDFVESNSAVGQNITIAPSQDVIFGRANFNPSTLTYNFTATTDKPDAVRVNIEFSDDSPNGPLPLYFAKIFGRERTTVSVTATAAITSPRDIAIVVDLSGSMKHDSYLRFYDQYQINARDVWASLDGPPPSPTYSPGEEHETEYAFDLGPTIGAMDTWGDPINPTIYDPTLDPGLWHIPQDAPCTEPGIDTSLVNRGYSNDEIDLLMAGPDSQWTNRTAVMIGLAEWTPSSSSDSTVSDSELTWIPYPPYRKDWVWTDYIGWAGESNSKLTNVHPEFQNLFGVKTYTDFLLDRKDNFSQTDLTQTPEEPMQAVKQGLQELVNASRAVDQISLEIFASTSRHEVDLSSNVQAVADRLKDMQPNHYDNSTNMGAGIQQAVAELTSSRARPDVDKIMVLMSDGMSSTGPDPVGEAQIAVDEGIRIYTISVGLGADRTTMQQIANMSGGIEFYATGSPSEYTQQLLFIYRTIGGMGTVSLIE